VVRRGLEPGAVVIVYPGSGIAAGSRVKPAAARAEAAPASAPAAATASPGRQS
jgi:hypothetical protein